MTACPSAPRWGREETSATAADSVRCGQPDLPLVARLRDISRRLSAVVDISTGELDELPGRSARDQRPGGAHLGPGARHTAHCTADGEKAAMAVIPPM